MLFSLYFCVLFLSFFRYRVYGALSDDADMLKAAAAGDVQKVVDFVKNKGVSLTTKNNNGVRYDVVLASESFS